MKLEDITANKATTPRPLEATVVVAGAWGRTGDSYGAERNAANPELAMLLNARQANMLFNCASLERDEIELANFILNKLDVNPRYVPSETLLLAAGRICGKLSVR